MILIEDGQMIETFSADTSNYSFFVRILKRRMGRGDHFVNLHPFYPASKLRSIDRISIPEQISRRGVIGKCFDDLLCGPLGCRIRGHIEMNDLPAIVKEDNEAVQNAEIDRRDCEKNIRPQSDSHDWQEMSSRSAREAWRVSPDISPRSFPSHLTRVGAVPIEFEARPTVDSR